MELHATDSNPIPQGAEVSAVTTAEGVVLRAAHWPAAGSPQKGTVCLLHGRGETIEKYFETVGDLRGRGFAVATLDWRGQGGSERRIGKPGRGHVDSFAEYDRDLDAFIEQVALPDCPAPYFALAHSTGALVALRAAQLARVRFQRMVLVSPLVALPGRRNSPILGFRIARLLAAMGLGELAIHHRRTVSIDRMAFDDNPLTSDPVRFERSANIIRALPQLAAGPPTFGWLYAAGRAMQEAAEPDFAPSVRTPVLVVVGSTDRIVSPRAMEALSLELRAGSQVVIPGGRHEILMERDRLRDLFWAAFDQFIPGSG